MTEAEASTDTANTSLSFAYDASGLRTGKTVTVQTYAETHTVSFVADGETVETLTVEDGYVLQEEDYPAVPEKTGYSGTWTPYTLPVTADITIQASYAPVQHTVTFVADGVTVDTIEVAHGYVLKDSDYPAVPEKPGLYGFWEEYTDPVESDITIELYDFLYMVHEVPRRDEGSCETYVSVIPNNERVEYKNNNIRQIIDSGLTAFGVVDYFLGFTNPYIAAILTFGPIVIEALPDQLRPADGKYDAYTVNTVRVYTSPEVGGYYIKTRIASSIYLWVDYQEYWYEYSTEIMRHEVYISTTP